MLASGIGENEFEYRLNAMLARSHRNNLFAEEILKEVLGL